MATHLKNLNLIFLFLVLSIPCISQQKSHNKIATNTVQNSSGKKFNSQATVNNMRPSVKHDTCLDKKFSIVFYLIQDSANSITSNTAIPLITNTLLTPMINLLNEKFKPICVSFENCSTVVIPNYNFNRWEQQITHTMVTNSWFTDKTINVYLPEMLSNQPPADVKSYASTLTTMQNPTITPENSIVIDRFAAMGENFAPLSPTAFFKGDYTLHAFGHFFGLLHTFDEINPNLPVSPPPPSGITSKEFVDRVAAPNCYTHGDGFCDTEADPWPIGSGTGGAPFCNYSQYQADGKGAIYIAPSDNLMSVSACRCRFSQEQYNYMAWFILKYRLYLH